MAKINLLTIHYGQNKGSFLQTYATIKLLRSFGHEVTVIDLVDKRYRVPGCLKCMRDILSYGNLLLMNRLRKKTFKPMTKVMSKLQSELLPAADYTIVGSDQTWNPAVTSSNAMAYFLDFVPETSKRIALSASFGTAEWHQKELIDKVSSELAKFHKISVREPSGVQICKNYFGVEADCITDPTIAWSDYHDLSGNIEQRNEVFAFILNCTDEMTDIITTVMHDIQLPVCLAQKNLLARKMPVLWKHCKVHNWFGNIDVKGFLQRIGGAKLVITDSFHGIVFCMLYNKPFISIPGANALRYERIANLLQETGLSYRTVRTLEDYESKKDQLFTSVDWQPIMELFEKRRAEFKDFIRCNIV